MATWPTAVATDAILYVAKNSLQTTLATGLGTSDTSVVLASGTGWPTAGAAVIGNEVIFYTGVSGATLTGCTRGADGTTAATHSVGVPVGAAIIAFHHNGLKDEIIAIETSLNLTASRAIATNSSGRLVVATTTAAELEFVNGVTSAIQTQMDLKAPKAAPTFTGQVLVKTGLVSSPSVAFTGDTTTGFYQDGAGFFAIAASGVSAFEAWSTNVQSNVAHRFVDGLVGTPGLCFASDPNTGIYRSGTDDLVIVTGGARALEIDSSQAVALRGTSTNNSATAGDVGEFISSGVSSATLITSTTGQYGDVTSITLTPGDWDVSGHVQFVANGGTPTTCTMAVSLTTGNSATGLVDGNNVAFVSLPTSVINSDQHIPRWRQSVSSNTTVYLKYYAEWTGTAPKYRGFISARRMR